jgi:predicted acetyltransferase
MMREWRGAGEEIIPSRLVGWEEDFEWFIALLEQEIAHNKNGVNSHLFFLVENGKILGSIQIRHHINHPNLIETGGHIGYGIRPSERGKWYGQQMLALALQEAKKIGLENVLIACYDDNFWSRWVIEKNGGVLEWCVLQNGRKKRRYWIPI